MLSYQHIYHAGGPADIYKHSLLLLVLKHLKQQGLRVHYIETHAGRGVYNTLSEESLKTGEAALGVDQLFEAPELPEWALELTQQVSDLSYEYNGHYYPGSPMVASTALKGDDKLTLAELHPREHKALGEALGSDSRVSIHKLDGYATALNALENSKRMMNVVMIDPSFEVKSEYDELPAKISKMHKENPEAIIMVWYPLLPAGLHEGLKEKLVAEFENVWIGESVFSSRETTKGMNGSGMAILGLPTALNATLTTLAEDCEKFFYNKD